MKARLETFARNLFINIELREEEEKNGEIIQENAEKTKCSSERTCICSYFFSKKIPTNFMRLSLREKM